MYTVLKILGLMQEQINLIGEISVLKISLSKLEAKIEFSRHLVSCHKSKLNPEERLAEVQDLRTRIEEKQKFLNAKGSEAALLRRELMHQPQPR